MDQPRRKSVPSGRSEVLRRSVVILKILYKEIESSGRMSEGHFGRCQEIVRDLVREFARKDVHLNYLLNETEEEADWFYNDAINTALLTYWYCRGAHFSETDTFEFTLGGLLHDVGQTLSDQVILHSRSRLNEETILSMHMHPQSGYSLLKAIPGVPESVMQAVLFHHERCDGEGYPTTLPYERLPLSLKIVGVADAFEAMVSDRPYRKRLGTAEALRQLVAATGGQFEYEIVDNFMKLLGVPLSDGQPFYREGQFARTSRGELGQVLFIGEDWMRPTLRLIVDAGRRVLVKPVEVSLTTSPDRRLVQIFTPAETQKIVATLRQKQSAAG